MPTDAFWHDDTSEDTSSTDESPYKAMNHRFENILLIIKVLSFCYIVNFWYAQEGERAHQSAAMVQASHWLAGEAIDEAGARPLPRGHGSGGQLA